MANGAGSPDCNNCRFVVRKNEVKRCDKHKFIIPIGIFEIICKDWKHYEGKTNEDFSFLLPGILYYYKYSSEQPPAKLDNFKYFNRKIQYSTLLLVEDPEFGWSIYDNDINNTLRFKQNSVTIQLDNSNILFEIAEAQRIFYNGGEFQADGSWKKAWSKGRQRIIFCPQDPDILYKWLNKQFDVERILYKFSSQRSSFLSPVRLYLLCELDQVGKKLRIKPFIPMYGEFSRHT